MKEWEVYGMNWQMEQESILKESNHPHKIVNIGRYLNFKEVMKSKKKLKKKNKSSDQEIFYKIDDDGEKLFMRSNDITKNNLY